MVSQNQDQLPSCLVVGNYCHDVLFKISNNDDVVIAESLGGATAFISAVLDGLSVPSRYICKVGSDFSYSVNHLPIKIPSCNTTLFHAHFSSEIKCQDRILKRVRTCDPITPSEIPLDSNFHFGLAVGVGGEILPETLEKMIDLCNLVLVDVQALIRVFDPDDGTVGLVELKKTEFFSMLPRIGVLKASAEEAPYVDVEEARKHCCVLVTDGKDGCTVYWKDGELQIAPFPTLQVDPTGAGDSFLGGFVAGLVHGLAVPDAALLGNFFGSLTVGQIGFPKFDMMLLQRVLDEVKGRRLQYCNSAEKQDGMLKFLSLRNYEQFHAALTDAKTSANPTQEWPWDGPLSSRAVEQCNHYQLNGHHKLVLDDAHEDQIKADD